MVGKTAIVGMAVAALMLGSTWGAAARGGHGGHGSSGHSMGMSHSVGPGWSGASSMHMFAPVSGGRTFATSGSMHHDHGHHHHHFHNRAAFFAGSFGYDDYYPYYDDCLVHVRTKWGWRWRNVCY